ncbi:MAG: DUF2291 domain-containing protein [Candidatus Anaerobiospirillum merdipullorum]|uniref:DUF2291 domain-containing protein n=1 Tax=Candidatus Anaerobiospirillum merdipullorum TaxID=2838450 RepID=A0A9E2NT56_9GAMM|nr:DUF2291 domain-containing protein [Candidatus Anaerobiospirillum merdipullorum]
MSKRNLIIGAAVVAVLAYGGLTATIIPEGTEAQLTGEKVFDPTANAQSFWQEQGPSYFEQNAVDLAQLFNEAGGDLTTVASKYGHYSMGDSGELSFIVKGTGTITTVKNKLRSGYLAFKPDGIDNNVSYRLQIGPVFKNASVRDTISTLSFHDYKNQIEWAQVSVALHDLVLKEVIQPVDVANAEGKRVEYVGCYTVTRPSQVLITPVVLKIQ